ncbi:hypothetical protein [Metallosphaera javensis (ex Sakai et al. 2022)]|uniref:hypothetical protein n=1 Tax=Metallosphaera javensis (ex Sakai et al. 2022) TaxID=2775498 RepID=UPI00258BAF94|nr:MAG: hypothetical protein MjAS7_0101 [Metallosphaera javensis (ex Sakai et al. 2022)]
MEKLKAFVRAKLRARTRRRFQGRWTKKRSRSFGLKVFPFISPALFALRLSSPTSRSRCRLSRRGLKLVDRGFKELGFLHPCGPWKYLRLYVEFHIP